MGGACGATPRLAATGCTNACRPRRWQFVACTSRRTVHRHAARPCNGASTPRLTQEATCNVRGACALVAGVVLAVSGRRPVKPSRGDAESAMSPFGSGRPVRPCVVVNPGGGWASWPQPSSENNFPCAARIPRGTNSFRLPALHYVAAASGAASPSPAGRITTRTRWARTLFHRKEIGPARHPRMQAAPARPLTRARSTTRRQARTPQLYLAAPVLRRGVEAP